MNNVSFLYNVLDKPEIHPFAVLSNSMVPWTSAPMQAVGESAPCWSCRARAGNVGSLAHSSPADLPSPHCCVTQTQTSEPSTGTAKGSCCWWVTKQHAGFAALTGASMDGRASLLTALQITNWMGPQGAGQGGKASHHCCPAGSWSAEHWGRHSCAGLGCGCVCAVSVLWPVQRLQAPRNSVCQGC